MTLSAFSSYNVPPNRLHRFYPEGLHPSHHYARSTFDTSDKVKDIDYSYYPCSFLPKGMKWLCLEPQDITFDQVAWHFRPPYLTSLPLTIWHLTRGLG